VDWGDRIMGQNTTDEKKVSKYGRPLGRPKGRRQSDLKRTILDLARQYRIPSLLWGALQEARKDMTKSEWFKSLVIVTQLMISCTPKEIAVSNSGSFTLHVEGLGQRRPLIVEGEIISDSALPPIPAREDFGNAGLVKELNAAAPPSPEPERDTRFSNEVKREHARREAADSPAHRPIGIF
jgi:hypothetical protein